MLATLTSKGQITLPKEIRDRLGLDAGSMLDFELLPDNTIAARPVRADARRVRGLLGSPHAVPPTIRQMDEGVERHLRDKHARRADNDRETTKPSGTRRPAGKKAAR